MARPKKKGLDYFPVDTNILQNKKVRRLKRRAGHVAFVLYLQILCDCYANSYFVKWNDDYRLELSESIEIQEDEIEKMVRLMVDLNLFDRAMFENNDVLTSVNIQNRYIAAKTQFLTNNEIDRTYLIVDFSSKPNVNGTLQGTKSASGEGKSAQNKTEENKILSERVRARTQEMEQWEAWNQELLSNEAWRYSVVQQAGLGVGFDSQIPEKLSAFNQFLVSTAETDSVPTLKDYQRRFHYWLRDYGAKRPKMGKKRGLAHRGTEPRRRGIVGDGAANMVKRRMCLNVFVW